MNRLTHFRKIRILPLLIALVFATLAALTAAPALATPACGFTTINLLYPGQPVDTAHAAHFPDGLLDLMCNEMQLYGWDLKTKVKGDSDVYVVQNTWTPGAHTGWHTHPGHTLIFVTAGALTQYQADDPNCTPHVYTAGMSFVDHGGIHIHIVRNEGTVEADAIAIRLVPAGQPGRIDVPDPGNCHFPPGTN